MIGKLSGIVNLLSTGASQPSYAANRHVIAQLSRTLINAFVSVDQVRNVRAFQIQLMYVLNTVAFALR